MPAIRQLLISLITLGAATASPFSWVSNPGKSLELRDEEGDPLVRFLLDPQPADPHFDILKSVGGGNLVWVGPNDHFWHYGQWFSWKIINGVNFWETDGKTGRSEGLAEVSDSKVHADGDTARISYTRHYRLQPEQNPVLVDMFTITITAPSVDSPGMGPVVDWSVVTTALADVTLDRTPLPDEPGGKVYGGYGGLSWRGSAALKDVRFTDSERREGMGIHRQRARWVNAVGTLDGKPAGIAIIAPTSEFEQPRSWYLVCKEDLPFWFINPAILQPNPLTLKQSESLTHRYQVVVHNGSWTPVKE